MSVRAGIVVTGTEVLTGRITDQNGPWLSEELLELGVDVAHITICGDRPADLTAQLRFLAEQQVDLIVTSGGLGPTADDLTVATVAEFCGRELLLDPGLEEHIAAIIQRWRGIGFDVDSGPTRAGIRKQALVPVGAAAGRRSINSTPGPSLRQKLTPAGWHVKYPATRRAPPAGA